MWLGRIAEGNEPDQQACASFAEEPLLSAPVGGVTYRHDGIRDALRTALWRIPDIQATLEPKVTTQGLADHRRADIKVHKDGTTWLVDVGVVCPGARRLLAMGTDRTPGHAAAEYSAIKTAKYSDQSKFAHFFIVETGGWIDAAGLEFFDKVSGALEGDSLQVRARRRTALRGHRCAGQAAGLHTCWRRLSKRSARPTLRSGKCGDMETRCSGLSTHCAHDVRGRIDCQLESAYPSGTCVRDFEVIFEYTRSSVSSCCIRV